MTPEGFRETNTIHSKPKRQNLAGCSGCTSTMSVVKWAAFAEL
jgi:hypothetical protein